MDENHPAADVDDSSPNFSIIGTSVFDTLAYIGYTMSLCFLSIHFYKFFSTKDGLSLATKNLTSYCLCLLITYLYYPIGMGSFADQFPKIDWVIESFTSFAASFLLLTMALDLCFCLRETVRYLRLSSKPRKKTFVVYSIINWGTSAIFSFVLGFVVGGKVASKVTTMVILGARVFCVVPFLMSLWYMRLAMMDKKILWSRLTLHVRLLVMTGVVSVLHDTVFGVVYVVCENVPGVLTKIETLFFLYEGFMVALCFTFNDNTFKSTKTGITRPESRRGSVVEDVRVDGV